MLSRTVPPLWCHPLGVPLRTNANAARRTPPAARRRQAEQDRLDLQHKLITVLMDNALYRSPIDRPRNVLDIATGTGIWAIQFAELHPESAVVGTDLSLIQPRGSVLPPNVSFVKEDSERDEWVFAQAFDFVYLRFVLSCFDDHRTVMRKALDGMRPGGWIELLDPTFELLCTDGTTEGTGIKRWSDLILQSGPVVGRDFLVAKNYKQWLLDVGFVDVVEEVLPCPSESFPLGLVWYNCYIPTNTAVVALGLMFP